MRQIASIQSLRALAALMVVVGHSQTEAVVAATKRGLAFAPLSILPWGAGVDLFFVISGFIMVVSSDKLFGQPGAPATFARRRLTRIVPLYWLFTTLYVLIQLATHKPVGGGDLLASYLFWPQDVYRDGALRPIFSLGWTLNYEMFFYAIFSLAIVLPRRGAVAAAAGLLIVGVALGRMIAIPSGPLAYWTQPIVLEFVLGMGIALSWRAGFRLPGLVRVGLAGVALAVLFVDPMGSSHQSGSWITPTDLARLFGWGLPAAGLVAAAAFARETTQLPRMVAWSVPLGDASYALYLRPSIRRRRRRTPLWGERARAARRLLADDRDEHGRGHCRCGAGLSRVRTVARARPGAVSARTAAAQPENIAATPTFVESGPHVSGVVKPKLQNCRLFLKPFHLSRVLDGKLQLFVFRSPYVETRFLGLGAMLALSSFVRFPCRLPITLTTRPMRFSCAITMRARRVVSSTCRSS